MKLTWHLKDMDTFRLGDRVKNQKQKTLFQNQDLALYLRCISKRWMKELTESEGDATGEKT